MISAFALALLAAAVQAQTPEAATAKALARVEALVAGQKSKDARDIAAQDREAMGFSRELAAYGWRVVPALAAAAKDAKRPPKVRLLAASFLGLTGDPAAFGPLEDILLDPGADPSLRAVSAQSLSGLGVPDAAVRGALCSAISQDELPRETLDDALVPLARLGCVNASALARLSRAFGAHPRGRDLATSSRAVAALGSSRGADSRRVILDLVAYFPPRDDARAAAIAALDSRREELALWLKPEALPVVIDALRTESGRVDTMLLLIRSATMLGPEAVPSLARLTRHPDAEILAAAAEALAAFKHVDALPALEAVIAGAFNDPRFSPKEGRPDPAQLLARVEKSVEILRRAR